jgi:hypothetical protein
MTEREDLLARLTELDAGSRTRRLTAISIQKMINHGDLAGATTALDDLELALHPALAAGGGGPSPIEGAAVSTFYAFPYTGGHVAFDHICYDPAGWWDVDNSKFTTPADIGELGLYIVSAQIRLDASGSISDVPEFEVVIGGTLWNYDPVLIEVGRAHDSNAYIGQVSLPLPIAPEADIYVDGYWGGFSNTPSADLSGILSVFKVGELAP